MAYAQRQIVERSDSGGLQPPVPMASPAVGFCQDPRAERRGVLLDGDYGLLRALRAACIGYVDLQLPSGQRYYSDECLIVMGYGPEDREVFHRGWVPLMHPDDVAVYTENRRRAFAGEIDRFTEEIRRMRRDGSFGWLRCTAEVIERDPEGATLRMVAMIEDVDAHHRTESRLRVAQQQIQALSAHVEAHLEAERKQIAADVHDQCGQVLTLLKMEVSALRAAASGHAELSAGLERLNKVADELVQMSRDLITRLRPPALDLGLVPALEWLTREWMRQTGLSCRLVSAWEDLPLPDEQATTLFRIVQESLTNAARHAQASWVWVDLAAADGGLSLQVADNGQGFDPSADHAGHFGLLGMRERAQRIGAGLEVTSRPHQGTRVQVLMPLAPTWAHGARPAQTL